MRNDRWLKAHQMMINGKVDNITIDDLVAAGKNMGLSSLKCNKIINDIEKIALKKDKYFEQVGVREKTYTRLAKVIEDKKIQ